MTHPSPFELHSRAFELEDSGDLSSALSVFTEALEGFADLISDDGFRSWLLMKARSMTDCDAGAVVDDFLSSLPHWLMDVHYERAARAISNRDLETARSHWSVLLRAKSLAELAGSDYIEICRSNLTLRFLKGPQLGAGVEQWTRYLKTAELLLKLDPGMTKARMMAIRGYLKRLDSNLEQFLEFKPGNKRDKAAPKLASIRKSSIRQVRNRLKHTARRLRSHLGRIARAQSIFKAELSLGYQRLSHYYLYIHELDLSLRMARRAARLEPQNREIRNLVQIIKHRGRRRR